MKQKKSKKTPSETLIWDTDERQTKEEWEELFGRQ